MLESAEREGSTGFKIAANLPIAMQRFGLVEPLVAPLPAAPALPSGISLVRDNLGLHVEAELAVHLSGEISSRATLDAIDERIDAVAPALEVVDYSLTIGGLGVLFDHCFFHRRYVLGSPAAAVAEPKAPGLPRVTCNGEVVREAQLGLVPARIAEAVAVAARRLALVGRTLPAGSWLLCGSYIEPLKLEPNATVEADFGQLGKVSLQVA